MHDVIMHSTNRTKTKISEVCLPCMYVCMRALRACTHMRTHMHTCMHYIHARMYAYMHACMHACANVNVHIHMHAYMCTHACMRVFSLSNYVFFLFPPAMHEHSMHSLNQEEGKKISSRLTYVAFVVGAVHVHDMHRGRSISSLFNILKFNFYLNEFRGKSSLFSLNPMSCITENPFN